MPHKLVGSHLQTDTAVPLFLLIPLQLWARLVFGAGAPPAGAPPAGALPAGTLPAETSRFRSLIARVFHSNTTSVRPSPISLPLTDCIYRSRQGVNNFIWGLC
jgi:hypothetical protein